MLLQPKKTKYRKLKKIYLKNLRTNRCSQLDFGDFGIKIVESARISSKTIESVRQSITKVLKKGKVWVRRFPHISVTAKPTENRMGKGKGSINFWSTSARAGTIIFEIGGNLSEIIAFSALKKGCAKLPVKTQIIKRL